MNTKDRNGNDLPTTLGDTVEYTWSARVAATNGDYSPTGWTYYEIPAESIVQRSRSAALDEGTWQLTMSILADALPPMVEPLAYYQLEVDLIDDTGAAWPYHTGPIDSVEESWVLEDGALVRVYEIQSFGVLQRVKGADVPSFSTLPPDRVDFTDAMTGIAQMAIVAMEGPFTAGTTYPIPGTAGGGTIDITVGTGSFPGVVVDNNSDFSSPLVYTTNYTITNAAGTAAPENNQPAYIKFVANQTGTWYIKFWSIGYWGILQNAPSPRPNFIRVPGGAVTYTFGTTRIRRTIYDDFATSADSGCTTTVIKVKDPEPFKSGSSLVKVTSGPAEFLEWTKVDTGDKEVREISSVDASGDITVSAFSAAPAEGDLIRLVTTQCFRAWERHNVSAGFGNTAVNPVFKDGPTGTAYPRGLFEMTPQAGVMRATQTRHWGNTDIVYADKITYLPDGTISIGSDNRLETLYYSLLVLEGFILLSKFQLGNPLLSWFKNIARIQTSVDQVLDEIGADGLPPNGYVHDRTEGSVLISAFRQKTSPDLVLGNVIGVQIGSLPEPVSSVTIRSIGEPRLVTSNLEPTLGGTWTNPGRLFDGVDSVDYAEATSGASVTFRTRLLDPFLFPTVSKFEVIGRQGVVEAYLEAYTSSSTAAGSRQLRGMGYKVLAEGRPVIIEREELEEAFAAMGGFYTAEWRITFKFYDDTLNGTKAAQVYEIKAYNELEAGWTAYMTDDLSRTGDIGTYPTGWNVENDEGFGPFYWVRRVGRAQSFRYANTDYLKRVLPYYSVNWDACLYRREIVDLTRINQVECRRIAESYLDEYIRQGRTYTVSAILDPRVDLGDTVNVTLGDGSSRDLFVWAIADSGGREDFQTTYTLLDYAA